MKKLLSILLVGVLLVSLCACDVETSDTQKQKIVARDLEKVQPTPTDIEYSLERYNLIRRAYWVNGLEEKARSLECPIEKPLGYIACIVPGVGVLETHIVDGKVSSLNSFLTPDTDRPNNEYAEWLADVDGSYGINDGGIFFFDETGEYQEWNGLYFYSSRPFEVKETILKIKEVD